MRSFTINKKKIRVHRLSKYIQLCRMTFLYFGAKTRNLFFYPKLQDEMFLSIILQGFVINVLVGRLTQGTYLNIFSMHALVQ